MLLGLVPGVVAGPGRASSRCADQSSRGERRAGQTSALQQHVVSYNPAIERAHMRAGALARSSFACKSIDNSSFPVRQSKAARNRWVPGRLPEVCCGGVLLSHNLSVAVPLALPGLASRFEMLLGVSPVL